MAEYDSGSVTESSDEEEEQLFVPRKKVSKVQETIYNKDCRSLWTTSSVEKNWVVFHVFHILCRFQISCRRQF